MTTGRIGYNFDVGSVTWRTGAAQTIPKSVAAKWIEKLNKDKLYMREDLHVQHQSIKYTVRLARYEENHTWRLDPNAILFVEAA